MSKQLVISGIIGGIIGSVLAALVVSSGTAQRDKIDTIQCRRLEVVDVDGNAKVLLSTNERGGAVVTTDRFGNTKILD